MTHPKFITDDSSYNHTYSQDYCMDDSDDFFDVGNRLEVLEEPEVYDEAQC